MYDPCQLQTELDQIAHGRVRLDAIYSAIQQADQERDYENGFLFRGELIKESAFYSDYMDAYIIFPEYYAMYEKYPELKEMYSWNVIWKFKWVIENSKCFYQISMNEARKYLDHFKSMSDNLGYSLRTYYYMLFRLYGHSDLEKANQYYEKFQAEPRDDLSDCKACEIGSEIELQLLNGKEELALAMLKPLSFGIYSCTEQPAFTYAKFGEYYFGKGEYEEAETYYKKYYSRIVRDRLYSDQIGNMLGNCSFINTDYALKIFLKYFPTVLESREPAEIVNFSQGACYLWKQIMIEKKKEKLKMKLPKRFQGYREDDCYDLNVLYAYFLKQAEQIGKLLDESNESLEYTNRMNVLKGKYQ